MRFKFGLAEESISTKYTDKLIAQRKIFFLFQAFVMGMHGSDDVLKANYL